jgi:hypothetical protein
MDDAERLINPFASAGESRSGTIDLSRPRKFCDAVDPSNVAPETLVRLSFVPAAGAEAAAHAAGMGARREYERRIDTWQWRADLPRGGKRPRRCRGAAQKADHRRASGERPRNYGTQTI